MDKVLSSSRSFTASLQLRMLTNDLETFSGWFCRYSTSCSRHWKPLPTPQQRAWAWQKSSRTSAWCCLSWKNWKPDSPSQSTWKYILASWWISHSHGPVSNQSGGENLSSLAVSLSGSTTEVPARRSWSTNSHPCSFHFSNAASFFFKVVSSKK